MDHPNYELSEQRFDLESEKSRRTLQLARLFRDEQGLRLQEDTKAYLLNLLVQTISGESQKPQSILQQAAPAENKSDSEQVRQSQISRKQQHQVADLTRDALDERRVAERDPEHICRFKIRQLVESNAPWSDIAPTAMALHAYDAAPKTAAQLLELAYLHGTTEDAIAMVQRLARAGNEFYWLVHESIRNIIAIQLWNNRQRPLLFELLSDWPANCRMLDIESLLFFLKLLKDPDHTPEAVAYYKEYRSKIIAAATAFGADLGVTLGSVLLRAGRAAHEHHMDEEALEMLGAVLPDQGEFQLASVLHRKISRGYKAAATDDYEKRLASEESWQKRMELLASFLETVEQHQGLQQTPRRGLNELLHSPLSFFPDNPQVWSEVSAVIYHHRHLANTLPNITNLFRESSCIFFSPNKDYSIWQNWLDVKAIQSMLDQYYCGVALLHLYVASGPDKAELLWQAKQMVVLALPALADQGLSHWEALRSSALRHISRNAQWDEKSRKSMIVQLDATMSQAAINSEVIRDLVNQTHHVPLEQLEDLRNQARILQDGNLEIQILHRVATEIHWTNQRLNDLWRLASSNQHVDLAWRAATVLSARKALSINGRQAWAICGENRSEYSFQTPDLDVIKCCMDGFSESEKKLIQGIITVGPAIPELLQALSMRKSSIFEISANQLIKNSSRLDEFIDSIPFFKGIKFSGHLNAPERINPLTIPPSYIRPTTLFGHSYYFGLPIA